MLDNIAETAYNRWLRYVKPHSRADWWFCGELNIYVKRTGNWYEDRFRMTPHEACRFGYSDQVLSRVNMDILSMEIEL